MKKPEEVKKADRPITCYLTYKEFQELQRECQEAVASVPGARMSMSAFLVSVYRKHLEAKRAAQAQAQAQGAQQ